MFDCDDIFRLLSDYVDEDLKRAVCREIQKHLAGCPDCTLQVDSVKKTIRVYREAGSREEAPVDVMIRLQDFLKRARAGEK
jgi:RNA polymerase sigma-70 factor (ECF subfamily)